MSNPFTDGTVPVGFIPQLATSGTALNPLIISYVSFSASSNPNNIYLTPFYEIRHNSASAWFSLTGTQSINNSTTTPINIGTTYKNLGGLFSLSNSSRINVNRDCRIQINAQAVWATNATGVRSIWFRKNGDNASIVNNIGAIQYPATSAGFAVIGTSAVIDMSASDYVEVAAWHNAGAGATALSSSMVSGDTGVQITEVFDYAIPTGSLTGMIIGNAIGKIGSVNINNLQTGNFSGTFTGSINGNLTGTFTGTISVGSGSNLAILQIDSGSSTGVSWLANCYAEFGKQSGQVMTSSTWTNLSWSITDFADPTGNITITSNGAGVPLTRITFASGGIYSVMGDVEFTSNASGYRYVLVQKNSNGTINGGGTNGRGAVCATPANGQVTNFNFSTMWKLSPSDYLEVWAFQSSGVFLTIDGGGNASNLQVRRLSAG